MIASALARNALAFLIGAIVLAGLLLFGLISLTASFWTAVGITTMGVGLFVIVGQRNVAHGAIIAGAGLAFAYFGDALPALTLGEAKAAFLGGSP